MASSRSKFLHKQKIAVGVFLVAVVGIAVYLTTRVVTDIPDGEFVEGEHYFLLESPRRVRGSKVEVMEFFSYGCVHCYNFDDELTDWAKDRAESVNLVRTPAIANEVWRSYGRAYYAMEDLGLLDNGHTLMFKQIHEARRNLKTDAEFAAVISTRDVSEAKVLASMTSSAVNQKLVRADNLARRFKIATVPSLVVDGKYHVRGGRNIGFSRMLDVVDYLIKMESTPKKVAAPAG